MKTFWRLLRMHRPQAGWLLLGLLLSLLTLLANVVLMATSGWFIAAMGLVGVAGITMNYFTPAAIIRACAIVRTTGRYRQIEPVIAWAEVARPLRFLNILFGLWLIVAPLFLEGGTVAGSLVGMMLGGALILLSLPRGRRSDGRWRRNGWRWWRRRTFSNNLVAKEHTCSSCNVHYFLISINLRFK